MFNSIEAQIVRQAMKLPKLNPQKAHEMELLLDQAYHALQNKQPKLARRILQSSLQSGGALEEVEDKAKNPTTEAGETPLSEKNIETLIQMIKYNPTFREKIDEETLETLFLNKKYQNDILPLLKAKKLQKWLARYEKNYNLVDLSNLQDLDLSHNRIREIPPEIGLLTNLQVLDLSYNQITEIPPEIRLLTNLQVLSLYHNQITKIPPEIGLLTNLRELGLSMNQITKIPPDLFFKVAPEGSNSAGKEIGLLTNLQKLYLSSNQITVIPPEIGLLTNLHTLGLRGNKITEIPPTLKRPGLTIYT